MACSDLDNTSCGMALLWIKPLWKTIVDHKWKYKNQDISSTSHNKQKLTLIHHKNIIKKIKKKRGFSGGHSIYEEALLVYCFQRMLVFVEGRKLEDYTQWPQTGQKKLYSTMKLKIQQGRRQWMDSGHVINCAVTKSRWSLRKNRGP